MSGTIVIVDDDPIIRMDIREMLEEAGYTVAGEAKNGEEAIERVALLAPDLVIMDVKMPVMNGVKASRIISRMQDLNTAILLLTAYSERELIQDAREAGVSAYLVKPITEADLIPAVEIALSQKAKLKAMKMDLEALKHSIEERKTIERAKGQLMKAYSLGEEDAYRRMRAASMSERISLASLAERMLADGEKRWSDKLTRG